MTLKRAVAGGAAAGCLAGCLEAVLIVLFSKLYLTAAGKASLLLAAAAMYTVYGAAATLLLFPPLRRLHRRRGEAGAAAAAAALSLALLYSLAFFLTRIVLTRAGLLTVRSFLWSAGLLLASLGAAHAAGIAAPPLLRNGRNRLLVAAALLALVLWSFLPARRSRPPQGDMPDVVLVTIDTIRADRYGCYGNEKVKTPVMDRLASEGVLFDNAIAQIPITNPSHLSILSSRYPHQSGVLNNFHRRPPGMTTVVDDFRKRGYATAAFVSSFVLDSRFGFAEGFDIYDDDSSMIKGVQSLSLVRAAEGMLRWLRCPFFHRLRLMRRAGETNSEVFSWLREGAESPFFLWVHYIDPHGPYMPPEPFSGMYYRGVRNDPENRSLEGVELPGWTMEMEDFTDVGYPLAQYDAEVTYTDSELGRLVRELDGRPGGYILVVAGDHGENMTEHGPYFTHGDHLYEEQVRVPLLFRWRERMRPGFVEPVVENIDIAPTILDLAGLEIPGVFEGESLLPLIRGEGGRRREGALSTTALWREGGTFDVAYRTDRYKLIKKPDGSVELYDLEEDPGELRNIEEERQDLVEEYEEKIREALASRAEAAGSLEDAETVEKLRSLGYIR